MGKRLLEKMVWTLKVEDVMKKQRNAKKMSKAIMHAACCAL